MKPELDKLLCDRYPEIFCNRDYAIRETCMRRGFECGDGWFSLIDTLCGAIQYYVATGECAPVIAVQVKEKFGTLRFYIRGGDEYVRGLIGMATALSARVCEKCGAPGDLLDTGGYSVLCPACRGADPKDALFVFRT